jgi:hypothetical protein
MITTTPPPTHNPPSPPSSHDDHRKAWMIGGSVFCVLALAYGVFMVVDLLSFGRDDLEKTFTEAIATVEIDSGAGSVRIEGTSATETVVRASLRRGLRAPNHSETVVGERLVLDSGCPTMMTSLCNVSYTVLVPADVAIVVKSSGGGVRLTDLRGPADVSSSGGGIRAVRTSGPLRLRASGGGITGEALVSANVEASSSGGGVRLGFASAPSSVLVESSGGGVTVELPNTSETYRLDATSSGGGVSTSVRTDPTSTRVVDVHSSGGGVTVRYPRT